MSLELSSLMSSFGRSLNRLGRFFRLKIWHAIGQFEQEIGSPSAAGAFVGGVAWAVVMDTHPSERHWAKGDQTVFNGIRPLRFLHDSNHSDTPEAPLALRVRH